MVDKFIIEIPMLPPRECYPNYRVMTRGRFFAKRRAEGKLRSDVYYATKAALPPDWEVLDRAEVRLAFVFGRSGKHDEDGLLSAFKHGLDALVDAGVIKDDSSDHLKIGAVNVEVDPKRAPLTVVEIVEDSKRVTMKCSTTRKGEP